MVRKLSHSLTWPCRIKIAALQILDTHLFQLCVGHGSLLSSQVIIIQGDEHSWYAVGSTVMAVNSLEEHFQEPLWYDCNDYTHFTWQCVFVGEEFPTPLCHSLRHSGHLGFGSRRKWGAMRGFTQRGKMRKGPLTSARVCYLCICSTRLVPNCSID